MADYEGWFDSAVPVLRVASVQLSSEWYERALGFISDPVGPAGDPVFAILRRDGAELMLQKIRPGVGSARSSELAGGGWDAYLRVDDVEAARARILASEGTAGPIVEREYGCRELELSDPDGHRIVIGECG